ncbi:MAG: hypothetical protein AAGA37_06265 [Actinomycetota bacterium]
MFVWFVATAVLLVLFVFDSPAMDYRWVAVGGVLPLVEALTGRPWILHTLLGSVVLLGLVMALTVGRRLRRRAWLGVPIGTFVFLISAGVWFRQDLFWWPVGGGFDALGSGPLPEFDRPLGVLLVMEAAAVVALVMIGRRLGFGEPHHREAFLRTGRVPKENLR